VQPVFDLCELEHATEQVRMEHPGQVYFAVWCVQIRHKGLGEVEDEASGCSAPCACLCEGEECSVLRNVGLGGRDGWLPPVVILRKELDRGESGSDLKETKRFVGRRKLPLDVRTMKDNDGEVFIFMHETCMIIQIRKPFISPKS